MPITLNGTGSITGLSAGGLPNDSVTSSNIVSMAATKLTGQVPDANAPSGSVIQVVQYTTDGGSTYSASDWTEMFNGAITPISTSNLILIIYQIGVSSPGASPFGVRIRRNTTVVGANTSSGGSSRAGNMATAAPGQFSTQHQMCTATGHFLDNPSTTSSITYRLDVSPRSDQTASWRLGQLWSEQSQPYSMPMETTLTLMEIAG